MAEQKKAAEEAKMKELAKQIQQEREKAEMGECQVSRMIYIIFMQEFIFIFFFVL